MLKVKIQIEDSNRKAEIELEEADNLGKLVIIQNVFNLFGVDSDLLSMVSTYNEIGKRYESFFKEVSPIEPEELNSTKIPDIKQQLIEGLTVHEDELNVTYTTRTDHLPEHKITGIKIDDNGTKRYQLYYICTACSNRGVHYIYDYSKTTFCHNCKHTMVVSPAHPDKVSRDSKGNYFVAGEFRDRSLSW